MQFLQNEKGGVGAMKKGYIYIKAKEEKKFSYADLKELIQIAVGGLMGGLGLYLGYCFLWALSH